MEGTGREKRFAGKALGPILARSEARRASLSPIGARGVYAMSTDAEAFQFHLQQVFGEEDFIRKMAAPMPGAPPVRCYFYKDLPEPGYLTAVTYGLSLGHHPDWQHGRPELMVCVKSAEEAWGLAAAYFAASFRGEKSFRYASLFSLDSAICAESPMRGFFTFAPPLLEPEQARVELSNKPVNLVGMYPLYEGEISLLPRIGLEAFWNHDDFDPYDVKRPDLSRLGWS